MVDFLGQNGVIVGIFFDKQLKYDLFLFLVEIQHSVRLIVVIFIFHLLEHVLDIVMFITDGVGVGEGSEAVGNRRNFIVQKEFYDFFLSGRGRDVESGSKVVVWSIHVGSFLKFVL